MGGSSSSRPKHLSMAYCGSMGYLPLASLGVLAVLEEMKVNTGGSHKKRDRWWALSQPSRTSMHGLSAKDWATALEAHATPKLYMGNGHLGFISVIIVVDFYMFLCIIAMGSELDFVLVLKSLLKR